MQWIKLSEQSPIDGKVVLAYDGRYQYVGTIDEEGICHYSDCCGCIANNITHWVELPEPPT